MQELLKEHGSKLRFMLIGGVNTLIDFALLLVFTGLFGIPRVTSNVISTSVAFGFSFMANKKYTFRSTSNKNLLRELVLFVVVTLFGLWVIQGVIISLLAPPLIESGLTDNVALIIVKLAATAVTMVWNYLLYSRLVFKIENS